MQRAEFTPAAAQAQQLANRRISRIGIRPDNVGILPRAHDREGFFPAEG
jgi:hypothetical protein